jgi:N-sulfoglucosamine sulfohydrolase
MQKNRRDFLKAAVGTVAAFSFSASVNAEAPKRPNILMVTADDMSFDTLGCYGNKTEDITPNLDKFAGQSLKLENGFVTVSVCQPCRSSWITGRLPQHNGTTGFNPIAPGVPRLGQVMKEAGYYTGIVLKVPHFAPATDDDWDYINNDMPGHGREPKEFAPMLEEFLNKADKSGKPFFLIVNITDPHRPFVGSSQEKAKYEKSGKPAPKPSRIYKADEIAVPGYLPDTPGMRGELVQYYNTAKRCDDSFGVIMKTFDKTKYKDDSVVMFLSDHGAPLPFAKGSIYRQSVQTPWMIRWPGVTKAGTSNERLFVNGFDLMPTVLDMAGVPAPPYMDGKSFAPALKGDKYEGFDTGYGVFFRAHTFHFNQRAIHEKKWSYIYNEWAAWQFGDVDFIADNMTPVLYPAAETDPEVARRCEFYLNRAPEELYDYENDPWSLVNLASNPKYYDQLKIMREKMLRRLTDTTDPATNSFRQFITANAKMKPVSGENLIENPGFDDGDKHWSGSGDTAEIVTDAETGNKYAQIVDISKDKNKNCGWASKKVPVKPGAFYTARVKVNVNCADGANVYLRYFDKDGKYLGQGYTNLPMRCFAPRMVEIAPIKAPKNAAALDFYAATGGNAAGVFWIDDVEVVEVAD